MLTYAAYGIDEDTRLLIDGLQRQITSQQERIDANQRQISSQQEKIDAQDRKIGVLEQTCTVSSSHLHDAPGSVQKRCKLSSG